MNLRLPTRFVMLDKAIATLGSVGVELYPDFNVFEVAKPYARDLMLSRFTPRRIASRARREGWKLTQMAAELPYQIHETLEQVRDGQIEVGFVHKGLDDFLAKLDTLFNRLVIALVVTGGLIGSSLIGIFAKSGPHVLGLHVVSVLGFTLSCGARHLAALGRHPLRPALNRRTSSRVAPSRPRSPGADLPEERPAHNRANGRLGGAGALASVVCMTAALLLADAEPETRGLLERHLPSDGFELVGVALRRSTSCSRATWRRSSAGSSGRR